MADEGKHGSDLQEWPRLLVCRKAKKQIGESRIDLKSRGGAFGNILPQLVCKVTVIEFGMSHRIKPKKKYVHISMKEVWCNLDGRSKNKECFPLAAWNLLYSPFHRQESTYHILC